MPDIGQFLVFLYLAIELLVVVHWPDFGHPPIENKYFAKGAAGNVPNVIAFTGYKWREPDNPESGVISLEEGADNCVAAWAGDSRPCSTLSATSV